VKLSRAVLLLALAGCGSPAAPTPPAPVAAPDEGELNGPPLFENVTAASGIAFTARTGETDANHLSILESLGTGVGLIDYDGDGLLDVYLPGGGGYAGADQKEIVGHTGKLYRNNGQFQFEDVTAKVGLDKRAGGAPWFYSHGVAVGDYDRDGWPDLLVTGWRAVALFRNEPDGTGGRKFADVTARAGLGTGFAWATSAALADLDGDGFPDLYAAQYVDWSWDKNPPCDYDGTTRDICPPRHFDGLTHKVFRNTGTGAFADAGAGAGLVPGGPGASKGLGVLVFDADGDGKPDVYAANDTVDNFLYLNRSERGAIKFAERGLETGVARDDRGNPNGSMGVAAGDPARTGRPALWVTNYENELHCLYKNESKPGRAQFAFFTTASGIAAIGQKYVGWGTAFVDADLDGHEDLFVANGHAIRFPTGKASSRAQHPVLLMNQGGARFRAARARIGAYATQPRVARGAAFGDLDNDGRTDIVIAHANEPVAVLRGIGGAGAHWLGVKLTDRTGVCPVGARAKWESKGGTQTRFAVAGGSFASSSDRRLLFGLAGDTVGKLTVTWADGTEQVFADLAADKYHELVRPAPKKP
jgi:hypothetical protein